MVRGMAMVRAMTMTGVISFLFPCEAKSLGVLGHTYPVVEEDMSVFLQKKLQAMDPKERLKHQLTLQKRLYTRVKRPKSALCRSCTSATRHIFDPSITTHRPLMVEGRVIAAKNTRVNPLRFVSLQAPLLFINGDVDEEVRWALNHGQPSTIILTHGSPFALMKDHDRVIYFDQSAAMVKRFAIRCTPTRMTQQGEALLIETVALSKDSS